jgi:uncharacterized protein (DUF2237 family)
MLRRAHERAPRTAFGQPSHGCPPGYTWSRGVPAPPSAVRDVRWRLPACQRPITRRQLGVSPRKYVETHPSSAAASGEPGRSVFGRPLEPCSERPKTGFFRDGCCNTGPEDRGAHVVCAQMTAEFLAFSRARGNDLSTPAPQAGFPGLQPGDRWCLCAERWKEALEAGCAPPVFLASTHERVLEHVTFEQLRAWALDLN